MGKIILDVKDLKVQIEDKTILKGIDFEVNKGECLCILGESGSGKSMTIKSILGILDNQFEITGKICLKSKNLLDLNQEELRKMRGSKIGTVLQNPMSAFDPLTRIEDQIKETFLAHTSFDAITIRNKSVENLIKMQLKNPEEILKKYPHQLSGGMLQRIMLSIAISLNPDLIIADEPTSAIDKIKQFEILKLLKKIVKGGTSLVYVTHDLGEASYLADKLIVMNNGEIVDYGTFDEILNEPKCSYSKMLIDNKLKVLRSYQNALEGLSC